MFHFTTWGYSSVVEHSTADREVPGSNPGVPYLNYYYKISLRFNNGIKKTLMKTMSYPEKLTRCIKEIKTQKRLKPT